MPTLHLKVSGTFETKGFQYYPDNYQENFFRPKDVESKAEMEALIASNPQAQWCLGLRTHDDSPSHFTLSLRLSAGGANKHSIQASKKGAGVVASVDGTYEVDVEDPDTLKYLKKALRTGSVQFSIVEVFMVRSQLPMTPFGPEGGPLKGIDWSDYPSMPQAKLLGNDIASATAKKSTPKKPSELVLPIKAVIEKMLATAEVAPTKAALEAGLQLNLGLSIPGGSNQTIVRPSDFDGTFEARVHRRTLKLVIDASVRFKVDAWVRKYAKKSPFEVTLNSYWNGNGDLVFLGDMDPETGYPADVVVGTVDVALAGKS